MTEQEKITKRSEALADVIAKVSLSMNAIPAQQNAAQAKALQLLADEQTALCAKLGALTASPTL